MRLFDLKIRRDARHLRRNVTEKLEFEISLLDKRKSESLDRLEENLSTPFERFWLEEIGRIDSAIDATRRSIRVVSNTLG